MPAPSPPPREPAATLPGPPRLARAPPAAAASGMLLRSRQRLHELGWDDLGAGVDAAGLGAPELRQIVDRARALAR
jgi:hypothetical protein